MVPVLESEMAEALKDAINNTVGPFALQELWLKLTWRGSIFLACLGFGTSTSGLAIHGGNTGEYCNFGSLECLLTR